VLFQPWSLLPLQVFFFGLAGDSGAGDSDTMSISCAGEGYAAAESSTSLSLHALLFALISARALPADNNISKISLKILHRYRHWYGADSRQGALAVQVKLGLPVPGTGMERVAVIQR